MPRLAVVLALLCSSLIPVNGFASSLINGLPVPGVQYPIHNLRHDTVLTLDENGTIITRRAYGNYGEHDPDNSSGVDTLRHKFTGQELDTTTGLYYLNARYYSPTIKRFLSPDPAKQDSSPYIYAADRPQQFIDPTGLAWEDAVLPEFTRNEHLILTNVHGDRGIETATNDVVRRYGLHHLVYDNNNDGFPYMLYDGSMMEVYGAKERIINDFNSGVNIVIMHHGTSTQRLIQGVSVEKFFSGITVNSCIDIGCNFGENRLTIEELAKNLEAPVISSRYNVVSLRNSSLGKYVNLLNAYANIDPGYRYEALSLAARLQNTAVFTHHYPDIPDLANPGKYYSGVTISGQYLRKVIQSAEFDVALNSTYGVIDSARKFIDHFNTYYQDSWQRTTF
ncbi:MAG: hypothetical protein DHS20C01_29800 [marine bacterium B5-7]|nr:MAG: hypothetical protein DHS20C01_29800 [marine bacterium B5-7]